MAANTTSTISGPLVDNGTVVVTSGTLTQAGSVIGTGVLQIGKNATLQINGTVAVTDTISFLDTAAALSIGTIQIYNGTTNVSSPYAIAATITGFQTGGSIIVAQAVSTATYTAATGILVLTNGTTTIETLHLAGDFTGKTFFVSPTTSNGAAISLIGTGLPGPATPVILSVVPDTGVVGDGITSATMLTLTGSAETNSIVAVLDGTTALGSATVNGVGTWSFVTPTLAVGAHSFSARATDTAGNTGLASAAMAETIAPSSYLWRIGSGLFGTAADWQNTTTGANPATSAPGINDTAYWANAVGTVTGTGSVAQLTVNIGTPGGLVLAGQFTTAAALFAGSAALGSGGKLTVTGKSLWVDGKTSAPATLTVNSGANILFTAAADTSTYYLAIASSVGSAGTVTVTGPNASIDVGANAASIGRAGTGSLSVSGGGAVRSATASSSANTALSLDSTASGSGTLTITSAGSSYAAVGAAFFGRAGSGSLFIDQGGSFTGGSAATSSAGSYGVTIGDGQQSTSSTALSGGSGTANVTNGSVLHSLGNVDVGLDGVTGTMIVDTGSTVMADYRIDVGSGADRAGGNGTIRIRGGSTVRAGTALAIGKANIAIGSGAGNNGTVNVTGAGSILDGNSGRISIGTNSGTLTGTGTGALTVSNGGTVLPGSSYSDIEAALAVGAFQNEAGTLSISGAGSKVVASGQAVIGGNNSSPGLTAGGNGSVSVATGGLFRASTLALFAGSTLTVDVTSIGVIGTTAGTAGLLTVDAAAATVTGAGAIHAKLLNNGSVIAQAGTLVIDNVDAASIGTIGASGGELDVASFGGTNLSFSGTSSVIRLGTETALSVAVTGFDGFDVLDFQNQTGLSLSGTIVALAGGKTFAITRLPSSSKLAVISDGRGVRHSPSFIVSRWFRRQTSMR